MNDNYHKLTDDFRGSDSSSSKNAIPRKSVPKKYKDPEDDSLKMPLLIMEKSHSQAY